MPSKLTAANVAEVAAWMRRWRGAHPVNVAAGPWRVLAHQGDGQVLVFQGDALRRLLPKETAA
ncbi:hypothetical protein Sme01_03290 [Sphaerisporangium melleum]|uniref:Uncharacterized protein n=1 Tax=Sphaerisporangium melleum TaxID=321316 RepID=A0A917QPB0_9ACTN|nr:hypothetical protein [Sphaerisporangium melleum]GGK61535.1 hypothetical protein GCM10007964_00830 [Sphaerisporangium melleum]GII67853.1 hypothetical protein Sme01_03290 [Sphaerisporangium melleum]